MERILSHIADGGWEHAMKVEQPLWKEMGSIYQLKSYVPSHRKSRNVSYKYTCKYLSGDSYKDI